MKYGSENTAGVLPSQWAEPTLHALADEMGNFAASASSSDVIFAA